MTLRATLLSAAGLMALSFAGTAQAQTAAAQPEAETTRTSATIIVTARKQEENLQDVPISVTALTSEAIDDKLIFNTTDVAAFTPGFQFNQAFGRDGDRPVIRGASNILIAEGKVGIFVDGAPLIGDTSGLDLSAVERIEVIKGPQSSVFGRGTLSGAINYVMKAPTDDFSGKLEATVGNYGNLEGYAQISGALPIIPNLRGIASIKGYSFDGDYRNVAVNDGRLNAQQTTSFNGALYWDPIDDLAIRARFIWSRDEDGHFAIQQRGSAPNNCFLTTRPYFCGTITTPSVYGINTDQILLPGVERDTVRTILDAEWDILGSGYTLAVQYSNAQQEEAGGVDQSYDSRSFFTFPTRATCNVTAGPLAAALPQNRICGKSPFNDTSGNFDQANTWEVRLSSPTDQRFRWRIGYFDLDFRRKPLAEYYELTASGPDGPGSIRTTENWAVFGGIEVDVTDNLKVGIEYRHQEDTITTRALEYHITQFIPASQIALALRQNPGQIVTNAGEVVGRPSFRSATFEADLPRVTVDYRFNPDLLVYAQYAEGNAPGGFNPVDAPQTTFDEEKLTNLEAGIKSSLFGFDYLNLAVFRIDYENQGLTNNYITATGGQNSYTANIGDSEITGLELEASRELFEGFQLTGTWSYLDAEFVNGLDPQQALFRGGGYCASGTTATILDPTQPDGLRRIPANAVAGAPAPGTLCRDLASVKGKRPPLVAENLASLSARYTTASPLQGFDLVLGADLTYRGAFFAQVDNLLELPSSTKLNLQVGLRGDRFRITAWGRNVTDEDAAEGALRFVDDPDAGGRTNPAISAALPAAPLGFQGTPRAFAVTPPRKPTFGITIRYDW